MLGAGERVEREWWEQRWWSFWRGRAAKVVLGLLG